MSKSNKELAVELYCTILNAAATLSASPRATATPVAIPSAEDAVAQVEKFAELLAKVKD